MKTVWYRVPECCEESFYDMPIDEGWDFETDEQDQESVTEMCADDYHSNHDGWENTWPLVISLHATEGGKELARFSVERENEPVFTASLVDAPNAT